jgi:hypothetical protein
LTVWSWSDQRASDKREGGDQPRSKRDPTDEAEHGDRCTYDCCIEEWVRVWCLCEELVGIEEGGLGHFGPTGELVDLALVRLEERLDRVHLGLVRHLLELCDDT